MPKSNEPLVSFSAGEWSPTMASRTDQQKYRAACLQMRNMMALKTGPSTRRPGTLKIAPTKNLGPNYCARASDFKFSVNTKFTFEWGHNYVRFYSNRAQVTLSTAPAWMTLLLYNPGVFVTDPVNSLIYYTASGGSSSTPPSATPSIWTQQSIYEVPTPYSALVGAGGVKATDVYHLQFCAINDVVYINHPNYPRAKLIRFSDTDWVYQVVQDLTPALLDQNATDTTIAASSAIGTTNLTATAPTWTTGNYYDVGSSVLEAGNIYQCLVPNTASSIFNNDLLAGYWEETPIFESGHVGAYWELAYLRDSAYIEYDGTAASGFTAGTSNTITAFGDWEVHTYGVWSADIAVQASSDGGVTWQTVRSVTGRNDRNVDITGTASQAQLYRLVITNVAVPITPGPTNPRVVFECVDSFLYGIVQITAVTDAYHATATVITQLTVADAWVSGQSYSVNDRVGYDGVNYICVNDTSGTTPPPSDPGDWLADGYPTIYWSEGAWSAVRGYPSSITSFEQRVWCGFSAYQPQRIWGTQQDDIENFDLGDQTLATDGVAFDLDAVDDGAILWLQAQDTLFVGLVEAEWVVSPSDSTNAIGPTNITAHRQSRWGSNQAIPAIVVGDALVFVQRQGFSMRQMLYSVVTNKYMSQDLTALSDEILNGGAIQLAYQKQGSKNGFVWATTANGELVGMTYELDQEIFGWHRHYTGLGIDTGFESVTVIPGTGTDDDEVWLVVNRQINGVSTRFMELLSPINWETVVPQAGQSPGYGPDKNQSYFVDCGVTYDNPSDNVFAGLDYLNGRTVSVCINATDYGTFLVAGGQITVDDFSPDLSVEVIAQIGLPFTSIIQPMNLDVDSRVGQTQGIKKKVTGLNLNFLNTLSCFASDGVSQPVEIIFRSSQSVIGEIPLFTGIKELRDFPGEYGYSIPILLQTSGPLPMTVRGVAVAYDLSGTP